MANDIKFYYINLDRRTDRRKYMENMFKKSNIYNYKRISAIDGKSLHPRKFKMEQNNYNYET